MEYPQVKNTSAVIGSDDGPSSTNNNNNNSNSITSTSTSVHEDEMRPNVPRLLLCGLIALSCYLLPKPEELSIQVCASDRSIDDPSTLHGHGRGQMTQRSLDATRAVAATGVEVTRHLCWNHHRHHGQTTADGRRVHDRTHVLHRYRCRISIECLGYVRQ